MNNPNQSGDASKDNANSTFNFAVATLERIHKILMAITQVTLGGADASAGDCQHAKYRLVRQLYVQASPLLTAKQREEFVDILDKIPLTTRQTYNTDAWGKEHYNGDIAVYNPRIERVLDGVTQMIQEKLQENGNFFMPKGDTALF